jgi:hypothetical protein
VAADQVDLVGVVVVAVAAEPHPRTKWHSWLRISFDFVLYLCRVALYKNNFIVLCLLPDDLK